MSDDVGTLRAASRIHPRNTFRPEYIHDDAFARVFSRSTLRPYMNNEYMRIDRRITLRIRRCFLSALPSDT